MKKMTIVLAFAVVLIAAAFVGCKNTKGQILDGPDMVRDSTNYPAKESVESTEAAGAQATTETAVDMLDIKEMPKTAVKQKDSYSQYAVYINEDRPSSGENELDGIKSVWLADESAGKAIKVCVTNPMAEPQWEKMTDKDANAVSVPLTQIAAADKAMIIPGDAVKLIVEGCPDGRNIWTYIIDPVKGTALQLPSSEGVQNLDKEKKEIIASTYGYDDDGRYSVSKVYSFEGKFLRDTGEKERE